MSRFNLQNLISYWFFCFSCSTLSATEENNDIKKTIVDDICNTTSIVPLTTNDFPQKKVRMCCDCCYNEDDILKALLAIPVSSEEILKNARSITYNAEKFKEVITDEQKKQYKITINNDVNRICSYLGNENIVKGALNTILSEFVEEGYHYLQYFSHIFAICVLLNINNNICNTAEAKKLGYKLLFCDNIFLYKYYYYICATSNSNFHDNLNKKLVDEKIFSSTNPLHKTLSSWLIEHCLFTPISFLGFGQEAMRGINLLLKYGSNINTNIVKVCYKRITSINHMKEGYIKKLLFTY